MYLYVESNTRGARLVLSDEKLANNDQVLLAQGLVGVAPTKLSFTKMVKWSSQQVLASKSIKVVVCLAAPTSWVEV